MRSLSIDRLQLIEALVAERTTGEISAALLEKDEHLTAALRAVFDLHFEHAELVLCGGTSLVKAHRIIERMSEDADIKVALSPYTASWSNTQRRRYLGVAPANPLVPAITHRLPPSQTRTIDSTDVARAPVSPLGTLSSICSLLFPWTEPLECAGRKPLQHGCDA